MILMYEDEGYYIEEYVQAIENEGFSIQISTNAAEFLETLGKNYQDIQLLIIDLMVFGPGNEFGGRSTDDGAKSGLVLLDEIEKIENNYPDITPKKKIIFTNRKGPVFEAAQGDERILKAIKKSDVLPSEFVNIVKEVIENGMD